MSQDIYGSGITYPPQLNTSGGIHTSAGEQKVEESIRIILGTQFGERVMRPQFGCNLKNLVFAPNNTATANLARYYIEDGLRRWEPRITVLQIVVSNDYQQNALAIEIHYRLRATESVHSTTVLFPLGGQ